MAALLLKAFAAVLAAVVSLSGGRVSAQTHHVLGGDGGCGPALEVGSWLSGRVFRVGDKISFDCSGTEDSIVELERPEDFRSCDLTNPIRMYTDPVSHVELEKEGIRYFTSANPENCKNGLKLNVPIQSQEYEPEWPPPFEPFQPLEPPTEYGPPEPIAPPPEYEPPEPVEPPPEPVWPPPEPVWPPPEPVEPPPEPVEPPPEPVEPPPEPVWPPPEPVEPPPEPVWPPPEPVEPPPEYGPPEPVWPPPPGPPSAATSLNGLSTVMLAGLLMAMLRSEF